MLPLIYTAPAYIITFVSVIVILRRPDSADGARPWHGGAHEPWYYRC
jgi:hypothetical protein